MSLEAVLHTGCVESDRCGHTGRFDKLLPRNVETVMCRSHFRKKNSELSSWI